MRGSTSPPRRFPRPGATSRSGWPQGLLAIALSTAGCATLVPTAAAPYPGIARQIVLRFNPGVSAATQTALAKQFGAAATTGELPDAERWTLPAGVDPSQVIGQLEANPAIKFAEPNFERHVLGYAVPSADYSSTQQWNLTQIRAPQAWSQYFSTTQPPGRTAQGPAVLVAVLDSGVDVLHPNLLPNIARDSTGKIRFIDEVHPTDTATSDIDTSTNQDFNWATAYSGTPEGATYASLLPDEACPAGYTCPGPDGHGHGTHVAGIIAAAAGTGDDYQGVQVVGVAPAAQILPVKIMHNDGNGDDWTIANGMVDAAKAGAQIENMSIGGPDPSQLLDDAVTYTLDQGVLIVVAAGENLPQGQAVFYPAAYPGVIAVGAVDQYNNYQAYSNFGPQVALVAPGGTVDEKDDGVLSTLPTYGSFLAAQVGATIPGYGRVSGTSQSAPHVAGVAALIWSLYPQLTAAQVRERLIASADPLGGVDFSDQTGWGLVDAVNALSLGDPRYGQ